MSSSDAERLCSTPKTSFLDLSGEIRNKIYKYAVDDFNIKYTQHPHLKDTYRIDLQTIRRPRPLQEPQWIRSWCLLRGLSYQVRIEADSFVSAFVLPYIILRSGISDTRYYLSEKPNACLSNIQRVEISDPGILVAQVRASGYAYCYETSKWKNEETSQDISITGSTYRSVDFYPKPMEVNSFPKMLRHYMDTAYGLIELPRLKQVLLTFSHWNYKVKIRNWLVRVAAFMSALSCFVTILASRHKYGPSIDCLTIACQNADLQMVDFVEGLGMKDGQLDNLPFRFEIWLKDETEAKPLPIQVSEATACYQ